MNETNNIKHIDVDLTPKKERGGDNYEEQEEASLYFSRVVHTRSRKIQAFYNSQIECK